MFDHSKNIPTHFFKFKPNFLSKQKKIRINRFENILDCAKFFNGHPIRYYSKCSEKTERESVTYQKKSIPIQEHSKPKYWITSFRKSPLNLKTVRTFDT